MRIKVKLTRFLLLTITLACFSSAFGQQRLLVIGGGERPPEAIKKFVEWSGGPKAKLLIITWATSEPEPSFTSFSKDLVAYTPFAVEASPTAPLDAEKRAKFVKQLNEATGVYFTVGDQNRIMDVLKDEELFPYSNGIKVSPTSKSG